MKKFLMFLCAVTFVFGMVGNASAASMTWTDTIDWSPDQYVGWFDSLDYKHDISDGADGFDGFITGGNDYVLNYSLTIALYDDGGRWDGREVAYINQPGIIGDGFYNFSYSNKTYGWSIAGLIDINLDGILNVSINSWYGDFYLDKSTLVAHGDNGPVAPVPEPSTILLMGAGLLGLVGYSRKHFSTKS